MELQDDATLKWPQINKASNPDRIYRPLYISSKSPKHCRMKLSRHSRPYRGLHIRTPNCERLPHSSNLKTSYLQKKSTPLHSNSAPEKLAEYDPCSRSRCTRSYQIPQLQHPSHSKVVLCPPIFS